MATHSSMLVWKFPWTEEPGRLQCIGLQNLDMTDYHIREKNLKKYIKNCIIMLQT